MKIFLLSIAALLFFANTSFSQTDERKALMIYMEANQHYLKKEYAQAGNKYKKAFELNKTNKGAAFNAARSYALANDADNAVIMAQKAYEAGMYGFDEEADFDTIRNDERFAAIQAIATADIESTKNRTINPVVVLPQDDLTPGMGMLVALHGYGGDPENFKNEFVDVCKKHNLVLVCLRATEITGKDAFHWNYSTDEYARIRTQIEEAMKGYNVEADKVILTGFSQGGYLSYNFGLQNTNLFKGLMPIGGIFKNKDLLLDEILNSDFRVYSLVGNEDKPSYLKQAEEAQMLLGKNDIDMKIAKYNGGHVMPENKEALFSEAIEWILSK